MNKKKRNTLFVYFKISISDLRNKFPEIETLVNSGNPVYLTKNGYGAMVVLSLEEYAKDG